MRVIKLSEPRCLPPPLDDAKGAHYGRRNDDPPGGACICSGEKCNVTGQIPCLLLSILPIYTPIAADFKILAISALCSSSSLVSASVICSTSSRNHSESVFLFARTFRFGNVASSKAIRSLPCLSFLLRHHSSLRSEACCLSILLSANDACAERDNCHLRYQ